MSIATGTQTRRAKTRQVAALIAALVAASSCSGTDAGSVRPEPTSAPTTAAPPNCNDDAACERFVADATSSPNAEGVDPADVIRIGRGLCAYAASADPTSPVTYEVFLSSTAESVGVDPASLDALVAVLGSLCPEVAGRLTDLRTDDDGFDVTLGADGAAEMTVSYLLPDGSTYQEVVAPGWQRVIHLSQATAMSVAVTTGLEAVVTCSIAVDGVTVVEVHGEASGDSAVCDASVEELEAARFDG